jgi:hypothetical protein
VMYAPAPAASPWAPLLPLVTLVAWLLDIILAAPPSFLGMGLLQHGGWMGVGSSAHGWWLGEGEGVGQGKGCGQQMQG